MNIMIDAGHGGSDSGAVGPSGLREKGCNLRMAQMVGAVLKGAGVSVGFTRTGDTNVTLAERCRLANAAGADLFLSIHCNSAGSNIATGTETYALAPGGEGERLAKAVQTRLVASIGLRDRGVKLKDFQVLRDTTMPAALVEVCFINNIAEEALLKTESFLDQCAQGICAGVLAYLGETEETMKKVPVTVGERELDAYLIGEKTYVALREIVEALQPKVTWSEEEGAAAVEL